MIGGFARAAQPAKATEVLAQMGEAGVTPNVHSYSAVVEAFAASGDPKEAEAWLRRAAEAGATPNVVTFSSVAKGYAQNGELNASRRVLGDARGGSAAERGDVQRLIGATISDDPQEALALLRECTTGVRRRSSRTTW